MDMCGLVQLKFFFLIAFSELYVPLTLHFSSSICCCTFGLGETGYFSPLVQVFLHCLLNRGGWLQPAAESKEHRPGSLNGHPKTMGWLTLQATLTVRTANHKVGTFAGGFFFQFSSMKWRMYSSRLLIYWAALQLWAATALKTATSAPSRGGLLYY